MKNLIHVASYVFILFLLLLFRVVPEMPAVVAQQANGTLSFFRVIDDKTIYTGSPKKYERSVFSSPSGGYERYIERLPTLQLKIEDVTLAVVEKQRIYRADKRGIQESVEEALGAKSQKKTENENASSGYVYKLTITLTARGAKAYAGFAEKHNLQSFESRLGQRRLSIGTVLAPFEGTSLTIFLEEKNSARLKDILSPIRAKVTWK